MFFNLISYILRICNKSEKKLIVIQNGKHSLSRKSDLKKICNELKNITKGLLQTK